MSRSVRLDGHVEPIDSVASIASASLYPSTVLVLRGFSSAPRHLQVSLNTTRTDAFDLFDIPAFFSYNFNRSFSQREMILMPSIMAALCSVV